ncbi:Arb2 domain-containing protein [Xylariaceae sp. FL0594]|nr:Arb2 domain-containing protein [Xylariaceae sp. FL0594]
MFKRKWSGLPPDPVFPNDLKGLGYFINKDDEIRSIENEDNYFKYFINRNVRYCDRQRFSMNQACQAEIHSRLEGLGLKKVYLPLGLSPEEDPEKPKMPIFVSPDAKSKSRMVIIFGETHQDLGILAHRVIGGRGGIDKGSLVTTVRSLLQGGQKSSATDLSAPGVILANTAELLWWPEGQRTLNAQAFDWAPMHSAAHQGNLVVPSIHHVPGNESAKAHIQYIFEKVVPALVHDAAGLDLIGIGSGADALEMYLNDDAVWKRVGQRLNCLAIVGGSVSQREIECNGLRQFLRERARAYIPSSEPLNMVLSGPDGNPNTSAPSDYGCPVFSAGDSMYTETIFIAAQSAVLTWFEEVALTSTSAAPYKNPEFTITYADPPVESPYWKDHKGDEGKAEGEEGKDAEGKADEKGDERSTLMTVAEEEEEEGAAGEKIAGEEEKKDRVSDAAMDGNFMRKETQGVDEKEKKKVNERKVDRNAHVVHVDTLDDHDSYEEL